MEIYLTNKCSVPGTVLSALEIISLLTLTIFYGHEIIHNEIKGDTVGHSYELKRVAEDMIVRPKYQLQ